MRILEPYILLIVGILILTMIMVMWFSIRLMVRVRRTVLTACVNISLLFANLTLFFLIMQVVLLDLELDIVYQKLYSIGLGLSALMMIISLGVFVYTRRKKMMQVYMMPDLTSIFNKAEDAIVIEDRKGNLLEMNQAARNIQLDLATWIQEQEKVKTSEEDLAIEVQILEEAYYLLSSRIRVKEDILGRVWVFHSIQEEKQLAQSIDESNKELLFANQRLAESLRAEEDLTAERTRLELIKQVQRELILEIEKAIFDMNRLMDKSINQKEDLFEEIRSLAQRLRGTMASIRRSVMSLSGRKG